MEEDVGVLSAKNQQRWAILVEKGYKGVSAILEGMHRIRKPLGRDKTSQKIVILQRFPVFARLWKTFLAGWASLGRLETTNWIFLREATKLSCACALLWRIYTFGRTRYVQLMLNSPRITGLAYWRSVSVRPRRDLKHYTSIARNVFVACMLNSEHCLIMRLKHRSSPQFDFNWFFLYLSLPNSYCTICLKALYSIFVWF